MIRPGLVFASILSFSLLVCSASAQAPKVQPPTKRGNAFVTALWFSHRFATPEALTPANDSQLKVALLEVLDGKKAGLTWDAVGKLFDKTVFQQLAGNGNSIALETMERLMQDNTPRSRGDLFPKVRQHADLLTTQFDLIGAEHHKAAKELVTWISKNYEMGKPLELIVVCTGNSRRSILGSTLGNLAAAYYGLPGIRFYSGGTTPSAFNARTIATLKEMGIEVTPSGKEAPRGPSGEANPIYQVQWGKGLEAVEFSKHYKDAPNPQQGFAALMVCSEADGACPLVEGASARIPVLYQDPKLYDGTAFEAAKYAERRDDMGRFMLSVMMQARRQLELDGKLK